MLLSHDISTLSNLHLRKNLFPSSKLTLHTSLTSLKLKSFQSIANRIRETKQFAITRPKLIGFKWIRKIRVRSYYTVIFNNMIWTWIVLKFETQFSLACQQRSNRDHPDVQPRAWVSKHLQELNLIKTCKTSGHTAKINHIKRQKTECEWNQCNQ